MKRDSLARAVAAAILLAALLLSGCSASKLPDAAPDMTGAKIVSSSGRGSDWTLLLEVDAEAARQAGIRDAGVGYATASVRVNEATTILRVLDGEHEQASMTDVLESRYLSVWFTGPVAESYPVQATAGAILILQ